MTTHPILKAALMACLLPGASARADVSSTASLSNLQVLLVDLRPDDGIAPSVSFAGGNDIRSFSLPYWDVQYSGTTPFSPLFYANSSVKSSTSASMSSDPVSHASAVTLVSSAKENSGGDVTTYLDFGYPDNSTFTLSPGTAMIIVGDGLAQSVIEKNQSEYDYAHSRIDMQMTGTYQDGTRSDSAASMEALSYFENGYLISRPSMTEDYSMMVSFVNSDTVADSGHFYITLSTAAISNNLAPIPEPATITLMLAGLGALEWRRRARPGVRG